MYINQWQLKNLQKLASPQKVVIIFGPRRCGKTTLINEYLKTVAEPYLLLNGEDITTQEYLSSQSIEKLKQIIGNTSLLVVDEAQKIKNIGLNLKLIVDHIPGIKVIASGSSAFDLARHTGEPLTGRKFTLNLFPLAQLELSKTETPLQTIDRLGERLIYGSYPEIVLAPDLNQKGLLLKEIVSSYLYKDILELDGIKHPDKLVKLLQLLVFQIGKEVSYTEIATQLGMSKNTIERYLDLLEKCFVVFKVSGFSRNYRKEITKNPRYFFYDLGIRNALINNFNPLSLRNDIGMLWENYLIVERMKKLTYQNIHVNSFFWRNYKQKEIDWVEETGGKIFGYEIKWGKEKNTSKKAWLSAYPESKFTLINRDNYLGFIAG